MPGSGGVRRLHHHRPHLARRQHQGEFAGRLVPAVAGVAPEDFNSYGSRRGNHEVMMRGTFANIRIKNEMLGGEEGGNTLYQPSGEKLSIYDAAMRYQAEGVPLVVIAGKEYGTGSSRDWAAKGTNLLGVKAVIAESFERIHRSNLIGMGVLALQFVGEQTRQSLGLNGTEKLSIRGLGADIATPAAHRRRGTAGRLARFVPCAEPHRHAERGPVLQGRRHPALRIAPANRQLIRQKNAGANPFAPASPSSGVNLQPPEHPCTLSGP